MRVEKLVIGSLATNCYLVWEEKSKEAMIIDPGDDGDFIIRKIQDLRLKPKLIIATHAHFDHVLAASELKLAFNIPFLISKKDLFLLKRAQESARHFLKIIVDPPASPDQFLTSGDRLKIGKEELEVLETPGHTPGSISLIGEGVVFTGDTLFASGVGRTDFSYSSPGDLKKSIEKLLQLPPDTIIYPGHGEKTTMRKTKNRKKIEPM